MPAVVVALATAAALGLFGGGASRGAGPGGETVAQSDASVPATRVTMIGATPSEAGAGGAAEVWGIGTNASGAALVRWSTTGAAAGQWTLGPALQDSSGAALSGFVLDTPEAVGTETAPSPLAGQMTPDGAGVLLGEVGHRQVVLMRDPGAHGAPFREVEGPTLAGGERLFSPTRAPLVAPVDETGSHAGALLVPVREHGFGIEESVLRWEGTAGHWVREPIERPASASASEFHVLGIGATSLTNAWLVAQLSEGRVALFHRVENGAEAAWEAVPARAGGEAGEPLRVDGEALDVPGVRGEQLRSQVLTVTSRGVWVDAERPEARASTTIYYSPEHEGSPPTVTSWCTLEDSPPGAAECEHQLPQALPTGASRSIAWSASEAFGERVITGLPEGVSLRLEGSSFRRVRALGSNAGGAYGAAFAAPREGWLGERALPVHLTLHPAPDNLSSWPVSFRRPLLAVAPAPGHTPGAIGSEAIAVGDLGEVARYFPGEGWLPEPLLGAGGRRQTPRLRAVAWPTQERAYAVGAEGAMWLWRGEVGRWEADTAAPYAFEGNLLGIAFDPGDPSRGYAVGQNGLLLGYGKTWTQEQLPAESPCPSTVTSPRCTWSLASFTSVAFAGSEAIVAYRLLPETDTNRYIGGLIINSGTGWHIDSEAARAFEGRVPWAVAALPDGGAVAGAETSIFEREGQGAPWRQTPTPYPGSTGPGSLALFREGGALRVLASGSVPSTFDADRAAEAPPGSPPTKIAAYPLATNSTAPVLAQTSEGWRDEEHALNDAGEPQGNWSFWDTPGEPDPISAVLVDPSGAQGWAVGGVAEPEEHEGLLDTAQVSRLGGAGTAPVGAGTATVSVSPSLATFAVGGNAQCAAPCADRSGAGTGPDVWLEAAVAHANLPGVRAFLYTGPRVVDRHAITGPEVGADRFSYEREHERLASILRAAPLPSFAAIGPTDLDGGESEQSFERNLLPGPFGGEEAARSQISPPSRPLSCAGAANCESSYYAFTSSGPAGSVRVIVLDDSSGAAEPDAAQRRWLASEVLQAARLAEPAIVVGQADLAEQQASGTHPAAGEIVRILAQNGASAYFFDSPERNITEQLRSGSVTVPAFGTGTLGYVNYQAEKGGAFLGSSGFLLAQVDVAHRNRATNVAPVTARLIPNVGELAFEARSGTLLRRSQVASFAGLARRPRAGNRSASGGSVRPETDPYIPLPAECVGAACIQALLPEATFTSSRPEVGDFVAPNPASSEPGAVLVGTNGKPVQSSHSGLFCAYNAGTTTVTVSAGGLSASLQVTVQPGSVGEPCGSVPISSTVTPQSAHPAATPTPLGTAVSSGSLPPPAPPVPVLVTPAPAAPHAHVPPTPAAPFLLAAAVAPPVAVAVPPPPAPAAEPTPPSGTSPVSSTAPEKEEEDEEAHEHSAAAVAYSPGQDEPAGMYLLGLVLIAALAGAGIKAGRGRRDVRVAPATVGAIRNQRRLGEASRPPRR